MARENVAYLFFKLKILAHDLKKVRHLWSIHSIWPAEIMEHWSGMTRLRMCFIIIITVITIIVFVIVVVNVITIVYCSG